MIYGNKNRSVWDRGKKRTISIDRQTELNEQKTKKKPKIKKEGIKKRTKKKTNAATQTQIFIQQRHTLQWYSGQPKCGFADSTIPKYQPPNHRSQIACFKRNVSI